MRENLIATLQWNENRTRTDVWVREKCIELYVLIGMQKFVVYGFSKYISVLDIFVYKNTQKNLYHSPNKPLHHVIIMTSNYRLQ